MKNNMNTIQIHEYIKIVQIKKYMFKYIKYFKYDMIYKKKKKDNMDT